MGEPDHRSEDVVKRVEENWDTSHNRKREDAEMLQSVRR